MSILSFLKNPKKKALESLKPNLVVLKTKLEQIKQDMERGNTSAFQQVIDLFNAASIQHDAMGVYTKQLAQLQDAKCTDEIETLSVLIKHITNAGRVPHGINRTKPGETVTGDNTYWRPIFGLHTKTLNYWESCKNNAKGGWGYPNMDHLNEFDVIENDVKKFIKSHVEPMIRLIEKIESWK